jgi:hypothetical protein
MTTIEQHGWTLAKQNYLDLDRNQEILLNFIPSTLPTISQIDQKILKVCSPPFNTIGNIEYQKQ